MNFGQAFSFVTKDPDWVKKVVIAALISLIPIIGQLYILGWALEITRRVNNGEDSPMLPETDFGGSLGRGFKAFVISLVYSIPIYIFLIPIAVAGGAASNMNSDSAGTLVSIVSVCCSSLAALYGLFLGFILPAAFGNFAAKGTIGDGLRFGEVFSLIKVVPVSYLIVLLGSIVAGFVGSLGSIACGIGVLFTYAYSMLVIGHFYGQAYREAKSALSAKGM
jgi:hypothetical protein